MTQFQSKQKNSKSQMILPTKGIEPKDRANFNFLKEFVNFVLRKKEKFFELFLKMVHII